VSELPRPSKADERRKELLPLIADAFSVLGYRRATTAELAARCGVQETILYRLWPDKKAMFLAAIDFLVWRRMEKWKSALSKVPATESRATHLLKVTGQSLGEHGLYKIIFAALTETDDPDIKQSMQRLYRRYHESVTQEVSRHREQSSDGELVSDEDTSWGLIALVAFMNIALDLELIGSRKRTQLFTTLAHVLLDGSPK
jgi:AcrR family transcriptional regulator